jgi:hypothetical protein
VRKLEIVNEIKAHCADAGFDPDPTDPNMLGIVHGTIDFSEYKEVKLYLINNVALPTPETNGSPNLLTYCTYPLTIKADWKMREGGVLYAVGIYGDFFWLHVELSFWAEKHWY